MKLRQILITLAVCGACSAAAFFAGRQTAATTSDSTINASAKTKPTTVVKISGSGLAADVAQRGITMASLLKSPGSPDPEAIALWAASLSPGDCAEALASLQALPMGVQRDALLKAVIGAWAKHDPAGFLAVADKVTNARLREGGVTDAVRLLAQSDPKAALDWVKQNPGTGNAAVAEARYNAAITGYAAADPTGAFAAVNAMGDATKADTKLKQDAMAAFADGMAQQGQYAEAMNLFNQLPDGSVKNNAYDSMIDRWGAAAPQDAANWIAASAPANKVSDYNETLADSWSKGDPAAAAAYAAQAEAQEIASGALTDVNNTDALPNAISAWAKYDLNAAGQFINQLPASPVKDRALTSFISTASKVDPAGAMAWATSASDPQTVQKLMVQVAKQWQQMDPNGLAQYISSTPSLTAEQAAAITNALQPAPAKKSGNNGGGNNQNGG